MAEPKRIEAGWRGLQRDLRALRDGGLFDGGAPRTAASMELRTGDVVLRLPELDESLAIASVMFSGYSHCGIVVEQDGRPLVADWYPVDADKTFVTRFTPWERWAVREGETNIYHWLVLRNPELDTGACLKAIDSMAARARYDLFIDHSREDPFCTTPENGNCTTFVRNVLTRGGYDCSRALALGRVSRRVFKTFIRLVEAGFYGKLPCNSSGSFREMACQHGVVDMLGWDGMVMPPGFTEVMPGFEVVAYGRPQGGFQRDISLWLDFYRRTAPMLRTAVRMDGVRPGEIPGEVLNTAGDAFRRVLRDMPGDAPLDCVQVALSCLIKEACDPSNYVHLPVSACVAMNGLTPLAKAVARGAVPLIPVFLRLARVTRWKPLRVFGGPGLE